MLSNSCYRSWARCQIFLCLERHTNEAKGSVQCSNDPFPSFASQTTDNSDKSYSVCNHTRDKQIGLPLRGRPILLSLVWLQTDLDTVITYSNQVTVMSFIRTGAIIRDGDRKSWDARGPMIWDNFSIFRTNCAILTSCIRANPRTWPGFSRGCCHVAWSKMVRVASFHSDGRE